MGNHNICALSPLTLWMVAEYHTSCPTVQHAERHRTSARQEYVCKDNCELVLHVCNLRLLSSQVWLGGAAFVDMVRKK